MVSFHFVDNSCWVGFPVIQPWCAGTGPADVEACRGRFCDHTFCSINQDICIYLNEYISETIASAHTLMYPHMYTHTCTHAHTFTHARTHRHTHTNTHTHTHIHTHTCILEMWAVHMYTRTHTHTHTQTCLKYELLMVRSSVTAWPLVGVHDAFRCFIGPVA